MEILIILLLWCLYWIIYWNQKNYDYDSFLAWWEEAEAEAKKQVKRVKQAKVWKDDNDA